MYVVRGNPKDVFPRLFIDWKVTHLTFEADIEPYSKQRDILVEKQAKNHNVTVNQHTSHTIYDPYVILQKNLGKAPMQYQRFITLAESINAPEPISPPKPLSATSKPALDDLERVDSSCYELPSLIELKVNRDLLGANLYHGGETEALKRMRDVLKDKNWVCSFEKPKTSPNSLEPSTTVLSPYLKFGCLSSRLLYKNLKAILAANTRHSKPPVSLIGQLMWREFFYTAAASESKFDRMVGNSICRQIPWRNDPDLLEAWTYGRTGYPFIDAVMRQLRQEGWIHHLARHAVACFLTRGDLWISWEEGQKVFEELLLDADWALNAGNWMWLSASAFFYQYFRVYSPVAFGKKTDKDGNYIRKYVPELKNYPDNVIYEPWKANLREQARYKCVLGENYPHRVVIHEEVSKMNIAKMAAAYKKHNTGQSEDDEKPLISLKKKKEETSPSTSFNQKFQAKKPKQSPSNQQTNNIARYFKKEPKSPT